MFIVWGTQIASSCIGHAADFCPFCRTAQQVRVVRLYSFKHVYYLRVGAQKTIGFEAECLTCNMRCTTDANDYASLSRRRYEQLSDCICETNPHLLKRKAERFDLEESVRARTVAPETRQRLVQEPFRLIAPRLEERYARSTPIDSLTWRIFLGGTLGALALVILGAFIGKGALGSWVIAAGLLLLACGLPASLFSLATVHRRYLRRQLYPALARCLAPLDPTADEIAAILGQLKQMRMKAGRKLKVPPLMQAIENTKQQQLAPSYESRSTIDGRAPEYA